MTPVQERALGCIRDFIGRFGFSPTFEEIRVELGYAHRSAVARLVDALEQQGKLVRNRGKERCLDLPGRIDLSVVTTEAMKAELARRGVTLDALIERPQSLDRPGVCAAEGCGERVSIGRMYCRPHWFRLTDALRAQLRDTHFQARRNPCPETRRAYWDAYEAAQAHLAAAERRSRQ